MFRGYCEVVEGERKLCVVSSQVFRTERTTCPDDGAPLVIDASAETRTSRVGHVLGNYRLIAVLGEGGIGTVYEAEHLRLGRKVALKLLHPEVANEELVIRFFNEARAVNEIRHPNIIDVEDFVTTPDGEHYMLMELLAGHDLRTTLQREHTLDPERVAAIGAQVASALAAVHAVGIIHRDLKPDNIFLIQRDGKEHAKLLDFGIAKFTDQRGVTRARMTMGTPQYMAPEQNVTGQEAGAASDFYALGMVMYECLTGAPAFSSANLATLLRAQCSETPVAPSLRRGSPISPVVEAAVLKCLAKDPADRFESATALHDALLGSTPVEYAARRRAPTSARPARAHRTARMIPALVMAIGALVLHVWPRSASQAAANPAAPPPIAAPAAVRAAPPTPQEPGVPSTIAIALASRPTGASLFLGKERTPLGTAPLTATLPISSEPVALIARFEDGREAVETIVPDRPRAEIVFVAPPAPAVKDAKRPPAAALERPAASPATRTDREGTLDPFHK